MSGNIAHIYQFHFQSNRARFRGWRFVSNHLSAQFIKNPQRLCLLAESMRMTQGQTSGQKPSFCIWPLQTKLNFPSKIMVDCWSSAPYQKKAISHTKACLFPTDDSKMHSTDSYALSLRAQYYPCQAYHQHILTQLSTGPLFIPCFHSPSPQKCVLYAGHRRKKSSQTKELFVYYPGANFSKQSVLIKELSYSAFYLLQSCLLSHSDFKFPCMPPHYINRSFVHDQVTRMFDVLMSLSSKTGACCSQWRYMTDITGTGRERPGDISLATRCDLSVRHAALTRHEHWWKR